MSKKQPLPLKNFLTSQLRSTLAAIRNLGREVNTIATLGLTDIARQAPPNTYLAELNAANSALRDAYRALARAYMQIKRISEKAGERRMF